MSCHDHIRKFTNYYCSARIKYNHPVLWLFIEYFKHWSAFQTLELLLKSTVNSWLCWPNGIWMHCMLSSVLCGLTHNPQLLKSSIININAAESPTRWDHVSSLMPGPAALSHMGLNCFSFCLSQFPIFTRDEMSDRSFILTSSVFF